MKIKTILVIIILLLVGVLGVVGMGAVRTYMSGAAASEGPKDVAAAVSADGKTVSITFTTEKKKQPTIKYGLSPTNMLMSKTAGAEATDHAFELTALKLNSTYYYSIDIDGTTYDNSSIPFSFSTTVKEEAVDTSTEAPAEVAMPTAVVTSSCDHTTDYNQDGVVNSLDYLECSKGNSTTVTPTSTDDCAGKDFNKDGSINSADILECRQSKNP